MPRRVSCIPTADHAFCEAATAALHRIDGVPVDDVASLLATELRRVYPAVEVHRQEALARVFNEDVWYVYRDGQPRLGWTEGG
jgi:hypothetical protein